jgi:iron complex outermembrane receptor protein
MKTTTHILITALAFSSLPFATPLFAATDDELLNMPIESLMNLTVTSVSKKPQQLTNAAAAIFVITEEDIRRSGATTIADALRMAPGVQVARVDSSKWAVTARGLNSRFANKLLVLQDGRSLYTPLFSGVYWEVQDTPLEDIDRIEVIRGPGAALWGANAVNGVINIITKSAEDTKGGLVSNGSGSLETRFATVRYGVEIGDKSFLRLYGKYNEYGAGRDKNGNDANDSWDMARTGFRLDSTLSNSDTLTVQGDYYSGTLKETYRVYSVAAPAPNYYAELPANAGASGANLLTRWQRTLTATDSLSLQLYLDHNEREMLVVPQKFNTVDVEFQHRLSLLDSHDIVWGLGYRFSRDEVTNTTYQNTDIIHFSNEQDDHNLASAFLHDEVTLIPKKLSLIVGSRFENNDYSGFEIQPNARLIWTPSPQHTLWSSFSRAVRTPSRGEQDLNYIAYASAVPTPGGPVPAQIKYTGNTDFKSEELLAYEIGYRVEPIPRLSFDISAYYNVYSKLRVATAGAIIPPTATTPMTIPAKVQNDMHGTSHGIEVSAEWLPTSWWRVQTAYSYQMLNMVLDNGSQDEVNRGNAEGSTPKQQLSLRNGFDLGKQVALDLWLRAVDQIDQMATKLVPETITIPGYVTMDVRLAWKPNKNLELAVVGQNLFQSQHPEFNSDVVNTLNSEVARSVYGKLTAKF